MTDIRALDVLTPDINKKTVFEKSKESSVDRSTPNNEVTSFKDHLLHSLQGVNDLQRAADQAATNLSTGKSESIHETMLAITQAELSFNFLVQVRNKALEAYQEVMRMPV